MNELYKRYRPKTLKGMVGQEGAIASLTKMIEGKRVPHCLLFTGPSGTGKTTIARALSTVLECGPQDLFEINSADFKGIDMVRDIRHHIGFRPMSGSTRVWIIDECHKLTGDAQHAFLKILEDTPTHSYFMLCTTDPQKLIKTIHSRASEVKLTAISPAALKKLLRRVIELEKMEVVDDVVDEIISVSDGGARKALVILDQVGRLEGEEAQMAAIQATTINKDLAISLARALINTKSTWKEVATILKGIEEDPEGIRYLVLGYARSVLLNSGMPQAFKVIDIFSSNFYDSKQAGLAAACWEVINTK
jgi:DNA polymerase III gamma/tau subunit